MGKVTNEQKISAIARELAHALLRSKKKHGLMKVHYILTLLTPDESNEANTESVTTSSIHEVSEMYKTLRLIGEKG